MASFPYFNGTGYVCVCIGKSMEYNEAQAYVGLGFIIPSIYRYKGEPVPLK